MLMLLALFIIVCANILFVVDMVLTISILKRLPCDMSKANKHQIAFHLFLHSVCAKVYSLFNNLFREQGSHYSW